MVTNATSRRSARPRVLVVDEKQSVADRIALFLSRNGFDAKGAYSTQEAFSISRFWIPSIVLADVSGSGREVVENALGLCTSIPNCDLVLMFSEDADVDLITHYKNQGENFEMLATPVEPPVLLDFLSGLASQKAA